MKILAILAFIAHIILCHIIPALLIFGRKRVKCWCITACKKVRKTA